VLGLLIYVFSKKEIRRFGRLGTRKGRKRGLVSSRPRLEERGKSERQTRMNRLRKER